MTVGNSRKAQGNASVFGCDGDDDDDDDSRTCSRQIVKNREKLLNNALMSVMDWINRCAFQDLAEIFGFGCCLIVFVYEG